MAGLLEFWAWPIRKSGADARLQRMLDEIELLLQRFESLADRHEKEWKEIWANNAETGPLVYWRDVAPYKHLVRAIRVRLDRSICWGASDCLERALTFCEAGKHETCQHHQKTCILCKSAKE